MIWNSARGGMRSVVDAYRRDGFIERENVRLIAAYCDGGFLRRQIVLLAALVEFAWLLATRRIELVHIHAAMRGSFWRKHLFASLARTFRVPVILHLHGSEMRQFYEAQRPQVQHLIRRNLEKSDRVLVLSESWRSFIERIAPAARITVVPNYVTVPARPAADGRDGAEVLFLGLVGPRKGTFDLIEAFAGVAARHPAARLTVGGNGEVEKAATLVGERGLGAQVSLAGWVDGEGKTRLLERSSIYALPSYNEGLPMSVLEAMAAELAVVTTRVGGIPELITDGVDGLLLEPGDKQGLEASLDLLLGDGERRRAIAAAGRRRVETTYSDEVVLPLLHRIYAEVAR
ncbi:glycosyltransferase family 4 protein [Aureimonas leprariae]|nr:glycosyltransferase family 4 protein [Aureimonas leprariae]